MGKTKIKAIDDAQPVEPKKAAKKLGRQDELVERLKAELAGEDEKLDVGSEKIDKEVGSSKLEEKTEDQTSKVQPPKPASKIQHPTSRPKPRSKKYQEVAKDLDKSKTYPLTEAVDMVKKLSYAKFNATLEAHINTVQPNIGGLVSLPFASGKTEYKTEPKAPVIHLALGKLDQPTEQLSANITTLLQTLGKSKVKKVTLSPTMGPSVKLDLSSV